MLTVDYLREEVLALPGLHGRPAKVVLLLVALHGQVLGGHVSTSARMLLLRMTDDVMKNNAMNHDLITEYIRTDDVMTEDSADLEVLVADA